MKQRPIAVLVDGLRALGATIDYVEREGYPPLRFSGGQLSTPAAELAVRGDISSQYISALLMVGPVLPSGLRLRLTGPVGSRPYIHLTLNLMRHFGAQAEELAPDLVAAQLGGYRPADYEVESDWSGASYWYAMVALAPAGSSITLPGLRAQSWQGDHVIQHIMTSLGVATEFLPEAGGVRLTQVPLATAELLAQPLDFTDCPDLAQTVAVVAAALGVPLRLTGLDSLYIKETDRVAAVQTELRKFCGDMVEVAPGVFEIQSNGFAVNGQEVETYEDHRMAMAFAPLALRGPLTIAEPQVVRKSYPSYWRELAKAGLA
jgi:3-phosphoshikimate 1-carboxyvinyltransferase